MTSSFSAPMQDAVHLIHSHTDSLHTRGRSIHERDEQAHRGLFPYSSLLAAAHPSIYPRAGTGTSNKSPLSPLSPLSRLARRAAPRFFYLLTWVGSLPPESPRHTSSDRSRTCQNEESNGVAKARAAHAAPRPAHPSALCDVIRPIRPPRS